MILALALLSQPAHALELRFWGVGPTLGTMMMPGAYPSALPEAAEGKVDKVGGDLLVGARGVVYPGAKGRISGEFAIGKATDFSRTEFLVGYDKVMYRDEELQVLIGGATGYGSETLEQKDDGPGALEYGYYPLRANANALLRLGQHAAEVGLDVTTHINSVGGWYRTEDDDDTLVDSGSFDLEFYGSIGIHATFYFGDFTAPGAPEERKPKKRRGKNGQG